ncbi:hypothetical protein TNCV_2898821 [Trichonephila clavipes]|nr:hypothetical protein TNCV_2898821 [Trichonephila clavipes]
MFASSLLVESTITTCFKRKCRFGGAACHWHAALLPSTIAVNDSQPRHKDQQACMMNKVILFSFVSSSLYRFFYQDLTPATIQDGHVAILISRHIFHRFILKSIHPRPPSVEKESGRSESVVSVVKRTPSQWPNGTTEDHWRPRSSLLSTSCIIYRKFWTFLERSELISADQALIKSIKNHHRCKRSNVSVSKDFELDLNV